MKIIMEITVDSSTRETVSRTLGEHHCRKWSSPEHPTQYETIQAIVNECKSWLSHYDLQPTFRVDE